MKKMIIHREQNETEKVRECLLEIVSLDPHSTPPLERLIALDKESQDWESVANWCRNWLEIQPMRASVLEDLALAGQKTQQPQRVIDSLVALAHLDPLDPAELNFELAVAYDRLGQHPEQALRHCLKALEETPRYEQALKLLLKLSASKAP